MTSEKTKRYKFSFLKKAFEKKLNGQAKKCEKSPLSGVYAENNKMSFLVSIFKEKASG